MAMKIKTEICDICGKAFLKKKSLSNHRRWHDLHEYKDFQGKYKKTMSEKLKNRILTDDWKNKISKAKKAQKLTNERNHNWKGDEVGYHCLHAWVRRHKSKPEKCQKCGKKTENLECANISGEYKRDLNDYIYLCRVCHMKFDGNWEKFQEASKKTRFKKGHKTWNKGTSNDIDDIQKTIEVYNN